MELRMLEFVRVLPFKAPRCLSKPSAGAAVVLAAAALAMLHAPKAEAFDDELSAEAVDRLVAARSREVLTGRATPIERLGQYLTNDQLRPQHSAAGGMQARRLAGAYPVLLLASVGKDSLPMSYPLDATPVPEPRMVPLVPDDAPDPSELPSLSGETIRWIASPDCLAKPLRAVLAEVASNFGPLRVNSTCRSKRHNAKVGGAKRSYHLTGNAVDFRISGAVQPVLDFLTGKRMVGGLKHYGFGVFHIDTGPRRTWGNNSWAGAKAGKARYAKAKYKKKRAAKRRRYAA
jgi:Peptidase M15